MGVFDLSHLSIEGGGGQGVLHDAAHNVREAKPVCNNIHRKGTRVKGEELPKSRFAVELRALDVVLVAAHQEVNGACQCYARQVAPGVAEPEEPLQRIFFPLLPS